MARLNVLMMTSWYPSRGSPVLGVFVRECAKAVNLRDHVVVLHCAGCDPSRRQLVGVEQETNEELTQGIPTYRCWYRRSPVPKTTFLLSPFLEPWSASRAYDEIVRHGFRPDIIHAHVYSAGLLAVRLGRRHRVPVVITQHSFLGRGQIRQARLAFEKADIVMPVSQSLRQAIEAYGIRANFQVVPNIVDTGLFHPNPQPRTGTGPKRLLCVCLLNENKGIRYLLEAVAALPPEVGPWQLDIVGDGPERQPLEALVRKLDIADRIIFHGIQPKPQVADLMRAADLFIVPSLTETFSVVAAEALASGLPVLTTRCGGPEEFVDRRNGLAVSPGSTRALCDGLLDLLGRLETFSREATSRYARERFAPEQVGDIVHRTYEGLVLRTSRCA